MNDKEFDLKMLENADNEALGRIAENCPASDEEKERMFAMSRKIYNERTKERNDIHAETVSGVEQYHRPVWQKFASIAAALVILGGAVTGGIMLNRNKKPAVTPADPAASATTEPSTQTTTQEQTTVSTESNCPFGDISNDRVRMMSINAEFPEVGELKADFVKDIADKFNKGKWTELSDATTVGGKFTSLYIYNNGEPYELDLYRYDEETVVVYKNGTDTKYYQGDEVITDAIKSLEEYTFEKDELITLEESLTDTIHYVWTLDKASVELPDVQNMQYELAESQLKEIGLNAEIVKSADITIKPDYVIKTEPEAGTKLAAGSTVKLYVSTGESDNSETTSMSDEDRDLIAKAQALYDEARDVDEKYGRSAMRFFNIDVKNDFKTAEGRSYAPVYDITLDELNAQYHKTFSDRYPDNDKTVNRYFTMIDGQLCWLVGHSGVDLYLESAKVTEIQRRTDDEIFFTVEIRYCDYNNVSLPPSADSRKTDVFSVVIQPDGSWKVGVFTNPLPIAI